MQQDFSPTISGAVYRYQYIDHGAQFRVYGIIGADGKPTDRVIKVPLDFEESKHALEPYLTNAGLPQTEIDRRIHKLMIQKQRLPVLLQGLYADSPQLMQLLGNLKLIPVLAQPNRPGTTPEYFMPLYFTQDQVTPMSEFLHRFRFAEMPPQHITMDDVRQVTKIMHAIVELHYSLWEYGIMESTFKLENIGIVPDTPGKVILVDGAEHTFDTAEARNFLSQKKWYNSMATQKTDHLYLPTILHKEYTEICDKAFTPEAFDRHWQKRSNDIERRAVQKLRLRERLARDPEHELSLWIQRQTLHHTLHSGIPKERIDTMLIPHADLRMLLQDNRVGAIPPTEIELQEQAERAMADSQRDGWFEIYRHMFPAMQ